MIELTTPHGNLKQTTKVWYRYSENDETRIEESIGKVPRVRTPLPVDWTLLKYVAPQQGKEPVVGRMTNDMADALHLALADAISVEDDLRWRRAVVALEGLNGARHARLQIRGTLLADLILDDARGPVSGRGLVHRRGQRQDGFLAECRGVEHVHPAYHGRLAHEGQVVHCPGSAAHFRVHLDQHLGDD